MPFIQAYFTTPRQFPFWICEHVKHKTSSNNVCVWQIFTRSAVNVYLPIICFFCVTCPRVHATEDKGVDNSQIPFQTMSFFGVVIQWLVKRRCALRRQIAGGRLKVAFYWVTSHQLLSKFPFFSNAYFHFHISLLHSVSLNRSLYFRRVLGSDERRVKPRVGAIQVDWKTTKMTVKPLNKF